MAWAERVGDLFTNVALVVTLDFEKGGTWAGAIEQL